MDNVTHTLIGAALARSFRRGGPSEPRERAVFWSSVAGSNLADLDFVARWLPAEGPGADKLNYLLHHRGWTHTLLFLPLVGALSAGLGFLIARGGGAGTDRWKAFVRTFLIGTLAAFLHVAADGMNEYGVHPLSPFSDRWFFGDTLFILEPVFWFALLPMAVIEARSRAARGAWILLWAAMLAACWFLPFMPLAVGAGLSLWALMVAFAQWRIGGVWPAWSAVVLGLWTFVVTGAVARGRIETELARAAPTELFTDLVLSPSPGNPFCRRVVSVSTDQAGLYRARIGAHSLWPAALPPERCLMRFTRQEGATPSHLAPWEEPTLAAGAGLYWQGEFVAQAGILTELIRSNCRFAAALNFIRVPYWTKGEHGLLVGDIRFDRGRGSGFAGFELSRRDDCPGHWPVWEMPYYRNRPEPER